MRKSIFLGVLVLAGILVIVSFSELKGIAETLQNADLRYLALAFLLQGVWFFVVALALRYLYRLMNLAESLKQPAIRQVKRK